MAQLDLPTFSLSLRQDLPAAPPSSWGDAPEAPVLAAVPDSASCPCGSGLEERNCCDLDLAKLCVPDADERLLAMLAHAEQAHLDGATDRAELFCIAVLNEAPGQPGALELLATIREDARRFAAATALWRRLSALAPTRGGAWYKLAWNLLAQDQLTEADGCARRVLQLAPEDHRTHRLMAEVCSRINRPEAGEYHCRQAERILGKRDAELALALATCLKDQRRIPEARQAFALAHALAPRAVRILVGWGDLEMLDRDYDAAWALAERAARVDPRAPGLAILRARLHYRAGALEQALQEIAALERNARWGGASLVREALLLRGRCLDRLGRYDAAFAAFTLAKQQTREETGTSYLAKRATAQIQKRREFFTEGRMKLMPRAGVATASPQPIFILGFPRSGTTMVEQTLGSHPRISAGDELPLIGDITQMLPGMLGSSAAYPDALCGVWHGEKHQALDHLRDYYLRRLDQLGVAAPGAAWVTDKMPLNEMDLGLIALIFPQSPLIHVIRHPLDVMLSIMSVDLTHGLFCGNELESAATHYAAAMDLVDHYRSIMPLRYLAVRYEDIVADQETQVRRMFDHIGEAFDPSVLAFHENRRPPKTASVAQVTEELYVRSRYRYRNYRKHLAPVATILRPVIERLGYSID